MVVMVVVLLLVLLVLLLLLDVAPVSVETRLGSLVMRVCWVGMAHLAA